MLRYAMRRAGLALAIVFCAMTLVFTLIHAIPGDPATIALGPRATEEMRLSFIRRMKLDQPIYIQMLTFYQRVLQGDLGRDVFSNRPVTDIIAENLPNTIELALAGLGWAALLGIALGCLSAIRPNSATDQIVGVLSVSMIAVPSFVVAIYLLLIFSLALHLLPVVGAGEPGNLPSRLSHLILPALAIGLGWVGYLARMVRASMREVLSENFIRTARAFGLPERVVIVHYALRIAILPAITLMGIGFGGLLSGAVFAEIVFSRPGIGKLMYDMVQERNYPVVQGVALTAAVLFAASTMIADLAAAWLDPRIRRSLAQ